jgi:hypothetical protein
MKGGLSKTKTKTYSINTTFNDFAINILSESIIAQEQGRRTQSAGAGFKDDFSTWLKMFADPIHDFNRTHPGFNLHNQRLFRIYDNILKYQRKSLEDEILLALLQDTRASHAISLKYMRFYKKPIVQPTITVIDDDTEMVDINQIWVNVESAFGEYNDKFYIFNSAITGLGTKDQFAEIVSVYYELFSYVVGHSIVAREIHRSSRQDSGTVDDFVRYVIAITALVDIHDRFDRIIAKIVKRSKWTKEDLLNENGKFDPLIRFFANALVIPDAADQSRKQVLQFLADKLLNTKRIIIGNDYTMLSARF